MVKEMPITEVIEDLEYLISGECTDTAMDYIDSIQAAINCLKSHYITYGDLMLKTED